MKEFSMILPCIKCNTVLESGHLYTRALLESLVKDFKSYDGNCLVPLGYNSHSLCNEIDYISICAKVNSLFMFKNTLAAEITVLDTPCGRIVQKLVEEQENYIKQTGKNKYDFSLSPVGLCDSVNIDGIEVFGKCSYKLDFFTFKARPSEMLLHSCYCESLELEI